MVDKITPAMRLWAYGIAAAALAVASVYGFIDGDQRAAWDLLMVALFGVAAYNVPGGSTGNGEDTNGESTR